MYFIWTSILWNILFFYAKMENIVWFNGFFTRSTANFMHLGTKMNLTVCQKITSLNLRAVLDCYEMCTYSQMFSLSQLHNQHCQYQLFIFYSSFVLIIINMFLTFYLGKIFCILAILNHFYYVFNLSYTYTSLGVYFSYTILQNFM